MCCTFGLQGRARNRLDVSATVDVAGQTDTAIPAKESQVSPLRHRQALNRRAAVVALSVPFLGGPARAQAGSPRRVGLLGMTSLSAYAARWNALRRGLSALGWAPDRNLNYVERYADGALQRLPALAAEIIAERVDVLVTHGIPGTRAALQATQAVPIVMAVVADPVAAGLVASYARPGGQVTGMAFLAEEMAAKRMQLLKEALPHASRVAMLFNPRNPLFSQAMFNAMQAAALQLGVTLQRFDADEPLQYPKVFADIAARRFDALAVTEEAAFNANVGTLAELALRHRLPSVGTKDFCDAGGLVGYGADFNAMFERAAFAVDRILRGARAGELPIEQPTRFELAANLRTAKTLGLELPGSLLLRSDHLFR
jgi:putative ABC transport system substrate-binding protein